jgi:hypothetical protein
LEDCLPKPAIASGYQLWALNRSGRLAVVAQAEPIAASVAFELVAEIKLKESSAAKRQPDAGRK